MADITTRLLKSPLISHLFEHTCTCGHIFYEVDSMVPRACPGCGHRTWQARGLPPKKEKYKEVP